MSTPSSPWSRLHPLARAFLGTVAALSLGCCMLAAAVGGTDKDTGGQISTSTTTTPAGQVQTASEPATTTALDNVPTVETIQTPTSGEAAAEPITAPTVAASEEQTAQVNVPGLGLTRQYLEDNIGSGFYLTTNVKQEQPDGNIIELKRTMVEGVSALNDDTWAAEVIGPDENVQTVSALFGMSWTEEGIRYGPMVMYKIALAAVPDDEEYLRVMEFIEQSADGIVAAHQAGKDSWEDSYELDPGRRVEASALLMQDGAVCTFTVTAKPED